MGLVVDLRHDLGRRPIGRRIGCCGHRARAGDQGFEAEGLGRPEIEARFGRYARGGGGQAAKRATGQGAAGEGRGDSGEKSAPMEGLSHCV